MEGQRTESQARTKELRLRRLDNHHQATLPLLPPAGILPPLLQCSRTILATLPPSSITSLRALISSDRLPRRLRARRLLTPARRLRRLRPTIVRLSFWQSRRRGIILYYSAPAAPSLDAAPAAPVQQHDHCCPAAIKPDKPSGLHQQQPAAKAAKN